jgi:hypothetical protein
LVREKPGSVMALIFPESAGPDKRPGLEGGAGPNVS